MSVEMEVGSCSASLPINVRVDELLPDQTYFIPLRIESVSSCMPSATKNFVLFEIQRRNNYATTKSSTYYTMTGTTQTGWIVDNIFGSNTRRQAINSSKLVIPWVSARCASPGRHGRQRQGDDPQQQPARDGRPRIVGERPLPTSKAKSRTRSYPCSESP